MGWEGPQLEFEVLGTWFSMKASNGFRDQTNRRMRILIRLPSLPVHGFSQPLKGQLLSDCVAPLNPSSKSFKI